MFCEAGRMIMRGNLFYKCVNGKLRLATKKELEGFSQLTPKKDIGSNSFYVSFSWGGKEMVVNIWTSIYSIGMTVSEFKEIYKKIENEEELKNEFIAHRV